MHLVQWLSKRLAHRLSEPDLPAVGLPPGPSQAQITAAGGQPAKPRISGHIIAVDLKRNKAEFQESYAPSANLRRARDRVRVHGRTNIMKLFGQILVSASLFAICIVAGTSARADDGKDRNQAN